jgi:hypothetical protein
MSTKAQRFQAATLIEQSSKNATGKRTKTASSKPAGEGHNLSRRAGKTARVAYEATAGRASRRSTRGSANHQRATNQLERTHQLAQGSPERRASASRARASKVRGKP